MNGADGKTVDLLEQACLIPVGCRVYGKKVYPSLVPEYSGVTLNGVICALYGRALGFGLAVAEDGTYVDRGSGFSKISESTYADAFIFEYFDGATPELIAVRGGSALIYHSGGFTTVSLGYTLRSGTLHCGRLFGINADDAFMIVWSGEGGIGDWNRGIYGAGWLRLDPDRGAALDIVRFGGKLVAVREYGISVVNANGTPENFSLKAADVGCERVCAKTAKEAGGKLFFCAESGLYCFDGSGIARVGHRLAADFGSYGSACALGNRYFVCGRSEFLGKNVVLCYDADDGDSFYVDSDADVLALSDKVTAFGGNGKYSLEQGERWSLTAAGVDFSGSRKKTVVGVYARGAEKVTISCGDFSRKFDASVRMAPSMRGESFTFTACGTGIMSAFRATAEEEYGI